MARLVAPIDQHGNPQERVRLDINDDSSFAIWDVAEADHGTVQMRVIEGAVGLTKVDLKRSNDPSPDSFQPLQTVDKLDNNEYISNAIDLQNHRYLGIFVATQSGSAAMAEFVPCFKNTTV